MRFQIPQSRLRYNLQETLRKCGYFMIQDRRSGKDSYVKRLSQSQHYPRFHLYIDEKDNQLQFNLHLDQKQASYKGQTAHSGEYDDPMVKEEAERIQSLI